MMYEFLTINRDDLIARCRAKVAQRPGRAATRQQLKNGVPLFLEQLIRTLRVEQSHAPMDSRKISGPSGGDQALSEMGTSAAQHGKDLLLLGLTVDEVVHDYGDLCQAITDLAIERGAPFEVDEFRTLNRCLDNAIADAVTEFSYQHDFVTVDKQVLDANESSEIFAHDLREVLATATLAFSAAKSGHLSLSGATGSILQRNLERLGTLIENSLIDVKANRQHATILNSFSVADFISEVKNAAEPSAQAKDCIFTVAAVDADLAISGERDLLFSAVVDLLQDAFKFTRPHTEVTLNAYAAADRLIIDVVDHCGGLAPGVADKMFVAHPRVGKHGIGRGSNLSTAHQYVRANEGLLSVRDVSDIGCVFTVSLPRHAMPT